jgi:hypothetical protein
MMTEPSRIPPSALALGIAGLMPFIAAALLQWTPPTGLDSGWAAAAGSAYGAVILSFLGGIRWGVALGPIAARQRQNDFALSVLPSLAGWTSLLLPALPGLALLVAGFLLQALWDALAADAGRLPQWFGRLRMILTTGAVASLIAILARHLT